jgi:hypothetical protein
MAAVTLEIIQSGSASTTIHAEAGDTLTVRIGNHTIWNNILEHIADQMNTKLFNVTGVSVVPDPTTEAS